MPMCACESFQIERLNKWECQAAGEARRSRICSPARRRQSHPRYQRGKNTIITALIRRQLMRAILQGSLNLQDNLGGPAPPSSHLNCHFKPHPLLVSSSPFPASFFFFLWQIKFTQAMQLSTPVRPVHPLLPAPPHPPPTVGGWQMRRPYLVTEGQRWHPINCQESSQKRSSKLIHQQRRRRRRQRWRGPRDKQRD